MNQLYAIIGHLRSGRYQVSTETKLQLSIAGWLEQGGIAFEREKRLAPGERIDFFITPGVGIEAKTRCNKRRIYRQLQRYAAIDEVAALVLITGTAMGLPEEIGGKPVFYVSLGRSAL
jgi:hypothetical protein